MLKNFVFKINYLPYVLLVVYLVLVYTGPKIAQMVVLLAGILSLWITFIINSKKAVNKFYPIHFLFIVAVILPIIQIIRGYDKALNMGTTVLLALIIYYGNKK